MKYIQRKGCRIKSSRFISATQFNHIYWFVYSDNNMQSGYWCKPEWNEDGKAINIPFGASTSSIPIRSVRAFRRRLKQWRNQLPKGTKVTLCSRYRNHNVIGVIR